MAADKIILTLVAIRESLRLLADIVNMLQAASGVTDEQLAKAEADAKAKHNELQETP